MSRERMDVWSMIHSEKILLESDELVSLPEDIKEAISRFSHTVKQEFQDKIIRIILFGSYARGDYRPDSDVDLLILAADDSWSMKKRIMAIGFDLYPDIGVMVTAKIITIDHYNQMKNFIFMQEVSRDGIAVA